MDFEALKQGLSAIALAISTLKQAKDLLPSGEEKEEVAENVEKAERQMKIAEANIAQSMGYKLCMKHFPPEIMLSEDGKSWHCPNCKNTINPKPSDHPARGLNL